MICLTNAHIVLLDQVLHGTILLDGTRIVAVDPGASHLPGAIDLDGFLMDPAATEIHTMVAHDAQCAAAGVTTVLDALCLGDLGFDKDRIRTFREGVVDGDALAETGLLKSEHFLHLRCEMPASASILSAEFA